MVYFGSTILYRTLFIIFFLALIRINTYRHWPLFKLRNDHRIFDVIFYVNANIKSLFGKVYKNIFLAFAILEDS